MNGGESIITGAEHLPEDRGTPLLTSYNGSRPASAVYRSLGFDPVDATFPVSIDGNGDGEQIRIAMPLGDAPADQQDTVYSTILPDQT